MQLLCVDIGTGTQDIFLFQSGQAIENGYKLVMPSPTMLIRKQIQEATRRGEALVLSGVTMGGGPCHWAAEEHLRAGQRLFATPEAARTFNDDLDWVHKEMGVDVISEDEAAGIRDARLIHMRDFDFDAITQAFTPFGFALYPDAVCVAVFDHGAAPPDISDRVFRFDYLRARIEAENRLSAFAYPAEQVPASMTRMQAVAKSASSLDCPLLVMDTAPAAVLGAMLDPNVASPSRVIVVNVGNFHTLAFRMGPTGIEAVFEHHTGEIDLTKLEAHLVAFADGSLTNDDIFNDHGHGALIFHPDPHPIYNGEFGFAVTGPRRSLVKGSRLRPYPAVPFGDMMLSGCFGLLAAAADHFPAWSEPILAGLNGEGINKAPWDVDV